MAARGEIHCCRARPAGRRPDGFTIVEMVVVLLLMSILMAVLLGRGIPTTDVDAAAQADRIRNHLRYAQSIAMKRSDTLWGIKFTGTEYWFFSGTDPDNGEVRLPGGQYRPGSDRIQLADLGITLTVTNLGAANTVFFDAIGKPYSAYTDAVNNQPLALTAKVTVHAGARTREITITPETGYIE